MAVVVSLAETAVVATMATTTVVNGLSGFFSSPACVATATDAANQQSQNRPPSGAYFVSLEKF